MRTLMKSVATVAFVALLAAPLRAELKYTMKMDAHKSATPAPADDPMMAMLSNTIVSTMVPEGGVEITCTLGDKGSRIEYNKAYSGVPAGGVTLVRPDGSLIVMDPATKTYWKLAKPDLTGLPPGMTPIVKTTKTGQMATIAGLRSERITIDINIPLPVPAGAQLPPGLPTSLSVGGEVWITPQYKNYTKAASLMGAMAALGLDKVMSEGLMTRSILRGGILGDQEVESVITKVGEQTVPATTFDVPADFKEVPPPGGGGFGGSRE